MKTRDLIRLLIWGLLFIAALACGVYGFLNKSDDNNSNNYQESPINYEPIDDGAEIPENRPIYIDENAPIEQ
jgi:hypothetical protein